MARKNGKESLAQLAQALMSEIDPSTSQRFEPSFSLIIELSGSENIHGGKAFGLNARRFIRQLRKQEETKKWIEKGQHFAVSPSNLKKCESLFAAAPDDQFLAVMRNAKTSPTGLFNRPPKEIGRAHV